MEPVQLANPDNAFEGGVLDKKWMFNVVGHLNLWHAGEVKLPSTEWGSGKIIVTNSGWMVDLTRLKIPDRYGKNFREFHIEAAGANKVRIYTGTLFGSLPTGFSVGDSPMFTLSSLANNDKIYAKVTWNRRVSSYGNIVGNITTRTIEAAATVPDDDQQAGTRHYQLATVTLGDGNIPVIAQSRWGPIDDLPGTARYNYYTDSGTTAQADYWDLLATGKGKQADGTTDIAPTYDSIQLTGGAFMRAEKSGTNLLLFSRDGTLNSQGQLTYASAETKVFDEPVVCAVNVNVLVGLRLNGGYLEGQYRTITVNAVATPSPEWVSTGIPVTAGTTIQCV